jgi:hypothetical protein
LKIKVLSYSTLDELHDIFYQGDLTLSIREAINYCYSIGDKDEANDKHIAYTLSAIYQGRSCKKPYDYKNPGTDNKEEMIILYSLWEEVQALYNFIGIECFEDIINNDMYDFKTINVKAELEYGLVGEGIKEYPPLY